MALSLRDGRCELIEIGRQHVQDGILQVRQVKTGAELMIPVHPELSAILEQVQTTNLTFLISESGKPFTAAGFSHWFRARCNEARLPHCSAHGLRKAAARRLAEAGCTEHEIAAITSHANLREIARHTKAADQQRLARAAMEKMSATQEQKLSNLGDGLTIRGKK